jgi:hypothetical protein
MQPLEAAGLILLGRPLAGQQQQAAAACRINQQLKKVPRLGQTCELFDELQQTQHA